MSGDPRFELKYRLDPFVYRAVLATVRTHMYRDGFSRKAGGAYLVRSLYYDTPSCGAYVEKVVGEARRVKLRVRTYDADPARAPFVSVELKCREAQAIVKHATKVPVADYQTFAATGAWPLLDDPEFDEPVLATFERHRRSGLERPMVLVAYEREAFTPRGGGPLRMTFDHHVRAAAADDLFAPKPRWRSADRHTVILEIKSPGAFPPWVEAAIRDHGLASGPNSKYTQAIEQALPAVAW